MNHRLRPASEIDKDFLFALHRSTMRELIEKTWGWDEDWQLREFERRFTEQAVSIIEVDGQPVGAMYLESRPDTIHIADFQVASDSQGRGLGTTVLRGLVADARARGVAIELDVLQQNPRARKLYERLGFMVAAEGDPFIRMRHSGA
jgi:ribosomal protein S18 acetylase RimI-like enzyme